MLIDVKTDLEKSRGYLAALTLGVLPKAITRALNNTLFDARKGPGSMQEVMKQVFDRPTPWTLNSLVFKQAKVNDLAISIGLGDIVRPATKQGRHLLPEIEGGPRSDKGLDRALRARGLLPAGYQAVPARSLPLDAYGNMKGSEVKKLLSQLNIADYKAGYNSNQTKASIKRRKQTITKSNYRVIKVGERTSSGKAIGPGIYFRAGRAHLVPLIAFVRAPRYTKRFDFFGTGERIVRDKLPRQFERAADYELRQLIK